MTGNKSPESNASKPLLQNKGLIYQAQLRPIA